MKVTVLGGSGDGAIQGSSFLCEADGGFTFLVDYGMAFLDNGDVAVPEIPAGKKIDACFITHAHFDHGGGLPYLMKRFPFMKAVVYSRPTFNLLFPVFVKGLRNQQARTLKYGPQELHLLKEKSVIVSRTTDKIQMSNGLSISFIPAGHIRGAMSVLVHEKSGTTMFSGDISLDDQTTVRRAQLPGTKINALFIEGSNGERFIPPREQVEQQMCENIRSFVKSGENVIIPASSISRGADIVFTLAKYGIKVYVDGSIRQVVRQMLEGNDLSWHDGDTIPVTGANGHPVHYEKRIALIEDSEREKLLEAKGVVVVTTPANLNSNPGMIYINAWMRDHRNKLVFAGAQHDGTNSDQLLKISRGETIHLDGMDIPINGNVIQFPLSAHARSTDVLNHIRAINPKRVVLTHAEEVASQSLKKKINGMRVEVSALNKTYEL